MKLKCHRQICFLVALFSFAIGQHPQNSTNEEGSCQFDVRDHVIDSCSLIINPKGLLLQPWQLGEGNTAYWIGGPSHDARGNRDGGYALAIMDQLRGPTTNNSVWMLTPPRPSTGPIGRCLKFKYQIEGLVAQELAVSRFHFPKSVSISDIEGLPEGDIQDNLLWSDHSDPIRSDNHPNDRKPIEYSLHKVWSTREVTDGVWKEGSLTFTSSHFYSLGFHAETPSTLYQNYRGYVTVDDIELYEGACDNDCNFDVNLCEWSNSETSDDFDWQLSVSSKKRATGPSKDQGSTFNPGFNSGGYAYADSGYPRRPYDRTQLFSNAIKAGDVPLCLSFWFHLYGRNAGSLRVLRRVEAEDPEEIWKQTRFNSVDVWYQGQVTISVAEGVEFKVIFEAQIGCQGDCDIAIDTITLQAGSCPISPLGSSVEGTSIADCTFTRNSCQWTVHQSLSLTTTIAPMLSLSSGSYTNPEGHTVNTLDSKDYYMKFDLGNYQHRVRDRAYLVSPPLQSDLDAICLSFWVYMFTSNPTEAAVGAMTVMISAAEKNITVWRLENKQHSRWIYSQVSIKETKPIQILIQGTKGTKKSGMIGIDDIAVFPSSCQVKPSEASVTKFDCSFDEDLCQWNLMTSSQKEFWKYADINSPITVVADHTYKIDKGGFLYIRGTNMDVTSVLLSAEVDLDEDACFSFYFASFYTDNTARLTFTRRSGDVNINKWSVTQANLPPRPSANSEVEWNYGHFQVEKGSIAITIDGKVRTGGWAIDDLKLIKGRCSNRPLDAEVQKKLE